MEEQAFLKIPLAGLYSSIRFLRIGDGPDEVHLRTIAKEELTKYDSLRQK